ncbi:branched-chain amino acid ABC transporter permease [Bacillus sp. FJAT-50079]|uniref:ABC transporter permease subunit n=1 Tax=Bacillus sp. FJAT-50079 TaxID=2833577 RepID=UPI001BC97E09|nr:branched-chain amino acid ABC transporter permease [Bacillus sp. FJAT-50079]MBS4206524.1 branched-chain amino acid ABC transporter permease [Bacillus sp. FJAT-50079]
MGIFESAFNVLYIFIDHFAFLILAAIGLAIIFGMMGIINLAHGEFIMLGAYITTFCVLSGIPLPISILIASLGVGLFGLIIDRLVIRHLYGRPLDSVVATWGISLIMSQGMLILMGPTLQGTSTPLGSFAVGEITYSTYRVVLFFISVALLLFMYWIFMHTKFGLRSRATMQNSEIARSLGTNTTKMYAVTFVIGSAFAGLAGGLYAPTTAISPSFGTGFLMESFVTVIVGGANPLIGTIMAGGSLGVVNSALSYLFGTFIGRLGLLVVAIIFIRVWPFGFSGLVEKRMMQVKAK